MSDVVFFFKSVPTAAIKSLSWPESTQLIAVDPPAHCMCGGTDPRCSTAYSCLWSSTGSLAAFLARYAPGTDPAKGDRVAFVGFSAAHGFLNPLLRSATDRAGISAVILFDASFGSGKDGYVAAVQDAMAGRMLLVATTGVSGGDTSWAPVWAAATGGNDRVVPAPDGLPVAPQETRLAGSDAFYLRYGSDLPHPQTGKIMPVVLDSYLVSWWKSNACPPGSRCASPPGTGRPAGSGGTISPYVVGGIVFLGVLGAFAAYKSTKR